MTEREPGILTEPQREFIRLPQDDRRADYNRQERYKYRTRIQRRLENAMLDFRLLHEFDRDFSTDDVADVFSGGGPAEIPDDKTVDEAIDAEVNAAAYVPTAVRFFARALDHVAGNDDGDDTQPLYSVDDVGPVYRELLDAVEKGIERDAAERKDTVLSVDVSLDVSGPETAELVLDRLEHGGLDPSEKLRLVSLLKEVGVDDDRLAAVAPEVIPGDQDDATDG
jgi:hypothetical protein